MRLLFDEPVTLSTVTLRALAAPAVTPRALEVHLDGPRVLVSLDTQMSPDVLLEVSTPDARDAAANLIQAPFDRARLRGWRPARPPTRRFDLWQMLPRFNRRVDVTRELRRFIACLQEVVDLALADIDRFTDLLDPERAPARWLDRMLLDLANPFTFELETHARRRLAASLIEMYRLKGTARGLRDAARFFLGLEVEVVPFADETLRLGDALLGLDWTLGAGEAFSRYAFSLRVARPLLLGEEEQLRALVDHLKPAHTHLVALLQPEPPDPLEAWVLGDSMLGLDAWLVEHVSLAPSLR